MGCVAQSITNLWELDGRIKCALVMLPAFHSYCMPDLGWLVEAFFFLFRYSPSSLFSSSCSKACWVTGPHALCMARNKPLYIFFFFMAERKWMSHGNIFAMRSALLQACLGCYNNSCCYICRCCGSWLAKRAIYITSLSNCQSFSISLLQYIQLVLSFFVFHTLSLCFKHQSVLKESLFFSAVFQQC